MNINDLLRRLSDRAKTLKEEESDWQSCDLLREARNAIESLTEERGVGARDNIQGADRSPHWPEVRATWLRLHPYCDACGAKDHVEVHHKKPFHLEPSLELDPTNFITLCEKPGHDCHFVFGHFHNWSAYNKMVVADSAAYYKKQQDALSVLSTGTPSPV